MVITLDIIYDPYEPLYLYNYSGSCRTDWTWLREVWPMITARFYRDWIDRTVSAKNIGPSSLSAGIQTPNQLERFQRNDERQERKMGLVERVARAICEADVTAPSPDAPILWRSARVKAWEARVPMARAAIDAMREHEKAQTDGLLAMLKDVAAGPRSSDAESEK